MMPEVTSNAEEAQALTSTFRANLNNGVFALKTLYCAYLSVVTERDDDFEADVQAMCRFDNGKPVSLVRSL